MAHTAFAEEPPRRVVTSTAVMCWAHSTAQREGVDRLRRLV